MASRIPYFPFYPSDFEAKTSHLSMAEDGAYNRLLRICWMSPGCSIPADEAWIMRRLRAHSDEEKEAVRAVLGEFFIIENGRYSNARLMQVYLQTNEAHEKRVNAGAKGGKNKSLKTKEMTSSNAKAMLKQPEPEPYYSVPNGTGELTPPNSSRQKKFDLSEPPPTTDPAKLVFDAGVRVLVSAGKTEQSARALVGRWRKANPDEVLIAVIGECQRAGAVDPVSWITAALQARASPRPRNRQISVDSLTGGKGVDYEKGIGADGSF